MRFVTKILIAETNSGTDNPLIFAGNENRYSIISGGNLHGEYPAKVLGYLAIDLSELGNMNEQRNERLNNPDLSQLPVFLIKTEPGLNCTFMIPHYTAALMSENKVFGHPSSIYSLLHLLRKRIMLVWVDLA